MEEIDSKYNKPDTGYMGMVFDTIKKEREVINNSSIPNP